MGQLMFVCCKNRLGFLLTPHKLLPLIIRCIQYWGLLHFFSFFRYVCEEHWPMPLYNYYYTIALLVLQFVIPLLVLIFTYTRIAFAVCTLHSRNSKLILISNDCIKIYNSSNKVKNLLFFYIEIFKGMG